jgi:hypothetical protein
MAYPIKKVRNGDQKIPAEAGLGSLAAEPPQGKAARGGAATPAAF